MAGKKKTNRVEYTSSKAFIDVSTKKHPNAVCVIAKKDAPLVLRPHFGRWVAFKSPKANVTYVICRATWPIEKQVKIHRIILGLDDPSIKVDHKDGDGLNNMRSNLRIANHAQNGANRRKDTKAVRSSSFKGVFWEPKRRSWRAAIQNNKKTMHLGSFNSERHAARSYNFAALAIFGRFAKLNDIGEI